MLVKNKLHWLIAGVLACNALTPIYGQSMENHIPSVLSPSAQQLLNFDETGIKFSLRSMMEILRDRNHEGWVLAAYPDPKTHRPLIGAGFSLDLPARIHQQHDPLNPYSFIEPSSAEMWQAAGLRQEKLESILKDFATDENEWRSVNRSAKIRALTPQITESDANQLLRVYAIQSIENARAYCRDFDRLSASQQLGLSQLAYQMGVNLEEFTQFLGLINNLSSGVATSESEDSAITPVSFTTRDASYWLAVQRSLIFSQWARLYRVRAISVIAMLDPHYAQSPHSAEARVERILRPTSHGRHRRVAMREAAYRKNVHAPARRGTRRRLR